MAEQLNKYSDNCHHKANQIIFPPAQCRSCKRTLEFVDYDESQKTVWVACPACMSADDNVHDYYSISFAEAGVNLADVQ